MVTMTGVGCLCMTQRETMVCLIGDYPQLPRVAGLALTSEQSIHVDIDKVLSVIELS